MGIDRIFRKDISKLAWDKQKFYTHLQMFQQQKT